MSETISRSEVVDGQQRVRLSRSIHEIATRDGNGLIMVRKQPVDRPARAGVMLVHGLGQNRYSWDLSKRSLANYLVSQGFVTYNVELRGHGLSRANGSDYPTDFETYLYQDIPALVDAITALNQGDKLFYMGHSLGGTISYCVGATHQEKLAGIISIAGPYSMATGNLPMRLLAKSGVLANKLLAIKKLHPDTFYIDLIGLAARYGLFLLDHRLNVNPLQIWYPESIERDILEERIDKGFDRTSFSVFWLLVEWSASGKLYGSGGTSTFEQHIAALEKPICFIVGDEDLVVPEASVREGFDRAKSQDKTLKVFGNETADLHWGHCDLICGRHAPRVVWPYILQWLNERV